MSDTFTRLCGILDQLFDKREIHNPNDTFDSYGADSLVLLEFILLCEDEFDIDLEGFDSHIEFTSTLAEITAVLDARMVPG